MTRKTYPDEETAFEDSRDWLRKVFFQLRHGVEHEGKTYVIDAPYCIKVEFHESGWVHYHAIFLTRRFLPKELLAGLWDRGWVTVQRITTMDFHYLLKYVTKAGRPAGMGEETETAAGVPDDQGLFESRLTQACNRKEHFAQTDAAKAAPPTRWMSGFGGGRAWA